MSDERRSAATLHQEACEVMARAVELPPAERESFVAARCDGDAELETPLP